MCIYSCVTLSTTLLIRAVQFNARSACDAPMFTSCIYIYIYIHYIYTFFEPKIYHQLVGYLGFELPKTVNMHSTIFFEFVFQIVSLKRR